MTHTRAHGTKRVTLEGEGSFSDDLLFEGDTPPQDLGQETPNPKRVFKFCRMFPDLPKFRPPTPKGLIELGFAMEKDDQGADHPNLPAGFTYLGQFVDHDITLDKTEGIPDGSLDAEQIVQGRSPTLDLDSLYLDGPANAPAGMYEDDRHLAVGRTTPVAFGGGSTNDVFLNDLPRQPPSNDDTDRRAIIGDGRNDENLAVAQTHLAFIKFHNKVVDTLGLGFEQAREVVTQHYQSIALHDFLPRIVDPMIYDDVIFGNGPQFFVVADGEFPCMPIEFSGAVYRLGHSMIRDFYHWNRVFRTEGPGPEGTLELLFQFSRVSGRLGDNDTLATNWIVDWRRMYEVPGFDAPTFSNLAHLLDTKLAGPLTRLPEHIGGPPELQSLASRNLLRGRLLGLPTGQDVARHMGVAELTPQRLKDSLHGSILEKHGFIEKTPLWYYILREAEVQHGGRTLGVVGSRIVMETFFGLIKGSRTSILKLSQWRPVSQLQPTNPNHYTMVDLLTFVDDLNPLGD